MQLFTIGLVLLNEDGTSKHDSDGDEIESYSTENIFNFARAWTGFDVQNTRGNIEIPGNINLIDPMKIEPQWRDKFPKQNLEGGYIGDHLYPLCEDLPPKMFLTKGAKFRFLGKSKISDLIHTSQDFLDDSAMNEFELDEASELRALLCIGAGDGCQSQPPKNEVILTETVECTPGTIECSVDTVRVIKVAEDRYWEFTSPPCIQQAFYEGGKKLSLQDSSKKGFICANPHLPTAKEVCCDDGSTIALMHNLYDDERVTHKTAKMRCDTQAETPGFNADMCDYAVIDNSITLANEATYHWTNTDCKIHVKVTNDDAFPGWIAIVHKMDTGSGVAQHVDDTSLNYFPAFWSEKFPMKDDDCGGDESGCYAVEDDCMCPTSVFESTVFWGMPESVEDALGKLFIGAVKPDLLTFEYEKETDTSTGIIAHKKIGNDATAVFDQDTIFEVNQDRTGRTFYLNNIESKVSVGDGR
eukprot:5184019-Ditylum_brightwellii.AAC.1